MKNYTSLNTFLLAFLALSPAFSSDTRVQSAGGLYQVMWDEVTDINPFTNGNPAGLALLAPQSRFDVAGQWFHSIYAGDGSQAHLYGLQSSLANPGLLYQGLIFFPTTQWALQGAGDFSHNEGVADYFTNDETLDTTREYFRTAYDFGPFTLGLEVQPNQFSKTLQPTDVGNGFTLVSGQGTGSGIYSTGGLLFNFPGDARENQPRLRVGGSFSTQAAPFQQTQKGIISNSNGTTIIPVTQNLTYDVVQNYGPEIYYEDPGRFQSTLVARFSHFTASVSRSSSNPAFNQTNYQFDGYNDTALYGSTKWRLPLEALKRSLNLSGGLAFSWDSSKENGYDPSQLTSVNKLANWYASGGVGLEHLEDFTLGLELSFYSQTGSLSIPGVSDESYNFFDYVASIGGEKWVSPHWAFRMGFSVENDSNTGSLPTDLGSIHLEPGQQGLNTTITAGVGFKDSSFHSDFMVLFAQPGVTNSPIPSDFLTQIQVQLAVAYLFP